MTAPADREVLETGLNPYEARLNAGLTKSFCAEFRAWPGEGLAVREGPERSRLAERWVMFLRHAVEEGLRNLLVLRKRHASYLVHHAKAATPDERRRLILDYARDLGADETSLTEDRKALDRWFDHEAIVDRYVHRHTGSERRMAFGLDRMGALAALLLHEAPDGAARDALWRGISLDDALRPFLAHDGDSRVCLSAFRALVTVLHAMPAEVQEKRVADSTLQYIYRSAVDTRQMVWIQCEAIELLRSLSPESFLKALQVRLGRPGRGDDLFVRRRAVRLLGENLERLPALADLLPTAARDGSPFVRQGLAAALARGSADHARRWLNTLAREDSVPQVRAAAVLEALTLLQRDGLGRDGLNLLSAVMRTEHDEFVLRTAVHVAVEGTSLLAQAGHPLLPDWIETTGRLLEMLHVEAGSLSVRRWAALARERIWCESDPRASELKRALGPALRALPPGRSYRLPGRLLRGHDEAVIGRVLSILAQDDFGFDLERRWWGDVITRGHQFRFRTWRLLHELHNPSPDKRQAFPHTVGRVFYGDVRVPSAILSELTETKVPGEPLFQPTEGGWRPYLPLVDEALSCLDRGLFARTIRFYTAEGVTELTPPRWPWSRIRARLALTFRFARYAGLRNWREEEQSSPASYAIALAALGFRIRFRSHDGALPEDPAVRRFFTCSPQRPAAAPEAPDAIVIPEAPDAPGLSASIAIPLFDGTIWQRLQDYFVSVYENSLPELIVFTAAALAFLVAAHLYANWTLRRARARLPLVIGGWGTRGKSGTERLKAALFNALGYGVTSKTTGCEAMFLHAHPYNRLREMFLYRPYDKATIWEQRDVVRLADRLGAQVFLWECMALKPSYVRVIQRQWMRDDLSTLTNAYPDHEDIQGPAGVNIPEVMTNFIPPRSRLLTSEELMKPILARGALRAGSSVKGVGWLEAGLLAPDVLRRFPYEEHPYNIALVLALADELGVDRDFALKEMADRVVPDLGVLRTTPAAPVRTRRLEFSNGMSANERFGCLTNWTRLGFDRQDPETEPGVWITSVVNNRADRVPRSRVFADVLVRELHADMHVLIGSNLNGMMGYLKEAWGDFAASVSLWPAREDPGNVAALKVLEEQTRRLRLPSSESSLSRRLGIMVRAILATPTLPPPLPPPGGKPPPPPPPPPSAEEIEIAWADPDRLRELLTASRKDPKLVEECLAIHRRDLAFLGKYRELAGRVEQAVPDGRRDLDRAFRGLLWEGFLGRIVVIDDYAATGNQLIDRIGRETPPGFRNRIMGIQNIKGTGLDFVYRWIAWETCHRACALLGGADPAEAEEGLKQLAAFQEHGVLTEEFVRETVARVRSAPVAQREGFQAQLDVIQSNLGTAMEGVRKQVIQGTRRQGRLESFLKNLEAFLDAGDAVKRRKQANRIYTDLAAERISHDRAARELRDLDKRQKEGWLLGQLRAVRSRLAGQPT